MQEAPSLLKYLKTTMKRFKETIIKILYPHPIIAIILTIVTIFGLTYIFTQKMENSIVAPIIYVISFYTLCVDVVGIIPAIKQTKAFLNSNKHTKKYLSEADFRTKISLYTGTFINLGFAVFKFATGLYLNSGWFIQVASYYTVLSIIRFILIRRERKNDKLKENQSIHQWKSYRLCAFLLLLLNTAVSGMVFRMIWQNKSFNYPGFIIYASAAYTFYRLIMTIIRFAKAKKAAPIHTATKALDLSISLMAIFSLQTGMFSVFGDSTSLKMQMIMNIFTGCGVCLTIVLISIIMICKADKKLKLIHNTLEE